jgi:hypothetical protein
MFLTPNAEAAGNILRFAITLSGNPGEQRLESTAPPLGAWQHVTVVLGPGGGSLYVNGTLAATNAALTLRPADLRPIANGWLGRSAYTVDAYLTGDLDDFRIYSIALSAEEVRSVYGLASR